MKFKDIFFKKKKPVKNLNINKSDSWEHIAKVFSDNDIITLPKDANHNTYGEQLDKLDKEGSLPWGWERANESFIKPHDKKLFDLSVECSNTDSVDDEIEKLSIFIDYYYSYKNECISKGECFYKYFCDMHMKCHNSKNECFEFVKPKEERLTFIKDNYEKLKNEELRKKEIESKIIPTLSKKILKIVSDNPGIMQTSVYTMFDTDLKPILSEKLYWLAKENKIERVKNGRSYKLYIK